MLKRAYTGTFHQMSPKHLNRYVTEFCGRHDIRNLDPLRQMEHIVARMVGKRLMYQDLTADNGLSSGTRSQMEIICGELGYCVQVPPWIQNSRIPAQLVFVFPADQEPLRFYLP